MSGRATPRTPNRPNSRIAKCLAIAGLLAGAVLGGLLGPARAQDPKDDPLAVDEKNPLPAAEPKRAALIEKFRIKKDRAIFAGRKDPKTGKIEGGIEDFKPVASEKENPDEYTAWHEVISHARQFTAAELEEHAARDLTRDDLLSPRRSDFRLDLMRFDGKLTKVRRVAASKSLADAGVPEIYEALLVPIDEPPNVVVSVVFTELPNFLGGVTAKPAGEWVEENTWATAAGYFFKVKQDVAGGDAVPILIARSVTPSKTAPASAATAENPTALDKKLRVFQLIRDDAFIAKAEDNWEEVSAWNRVLLHARRFMPDELEKAAGEVKFADLFLDTRRDYKLDLLKFEGRLIMLNKSKPSEKLLAAGVETLYEGWIVPKDEPRGNPICVVFTDPPEGVEPTGRVNKWVSFAGYSFKLLRYKSGERDKDDPNRNVTKRAPLLLGRAVTARPDPDAPTSLTWTGFMNAALAAVVGLIVIGGGVSLWFRRGDRKTRQEIAAHRGRNPFTEGGTQPGTM